MKRRTDTIMSSSYGTDDFVNLIKPLIEKYANKKQTIDIELNVTLDEAMEIFSLLKKLRADTNE